MSSVQTLQLLKSANMWHNAKQLHQTKMEQKLAGVSAHRSVLTFDLQKHELLVRHGAVVGRLLRLADAAQAHAAEVLLTGQTGQSCFRETGGLIHCKKDETGNGDVLMHTLQKQAP